MTRKEKATNVRFFKHEANDAKDRLMYIRDKIAQYSESEARKLDTLIGKLEHWQNK